MQTVIKSMIIRLFPTKEQEQMMWNHVHAARYIWNYMLDWQIKRYDNGNGEKKFSKYDFTYRLPETKSQPEHAWLKDEISAKIGRAHV